MDPNVVLSFCIFIVLLSCHHSFATESDVTALIKPGTRECFHEYATEGTLLEFEYQVVEGGDLDVNFMLQSPSGRVLITERRKREAVHKVDVKETGNYMLCIDNTFSRFSRKIVFLEVLTDEPDPEWKGQDYMFANLEEDDGQYEVTLDDFREVVDKMKKRLSESRQLQRQIRNHELRDRSIQEDNFMRVNRWSTIQLGVMVTVGFIQVIMIRSLFDDKSKAKKSMKMTT